MDGLRLIRWHDKVTAADFIASLRFSWYPSIIMAAMSSVASSFKRQRLLCLYLPLLIIVNVAGETFLINDYSVSLS